MNILFCNIAWMKYYRNVTEEDKPRNGGAYIAENDYGHECSNFLPCNGECYGFVMLNGDISLEKHFKGALRQNAYVNDVLVVWVALEEKNKIRVVGWYKNATVYRTLQRLPEEAVNNDNNWSYRIKALEKDCYLLPEDKRTFEIPRANKAGKGCGMGRSNIWYAESEKARQELIPNLQEYIENYKGEFIGR